MSQQEDEDRKRKMTPEASGGPFAHWRTSKKSRIERGSPVIHPARPPSKLLLVQHHMLLEVLMVKAVMVMVTVKVPEQDPSHPSHVSATTSDSSGRGRRT